MKDPKIQKTLKKLIPTLDELGISYVVIGGNAVYIHGYKRYTEDIDILVTKDGQQTIMSHLFQLGLMPRFKNAETSFKDTLTKIGIDLVISGKEKLGKGTYPEPDKLQTVSHQGITFVGLIDLINIKIESGRDRDIADVSELIKYLKLDEDFYKKLNSDAQSEFRQIWKRAQPDLKEFNNPNYWDDTEVDALLDAVNEGKITLEEAYEMMESGDFIKDLKNLHGEDDFTGWISPDAKFYSFSKYKVDSHIKVAYQIEPDLKGNTTIVDDMFELGYIRVLVENDELNIQYDGSERPNTSALFNMCLKVLDHYSDLRIIRFEVGNPSFFTSIIGRLKREAEIFDVRVVKENKTTGKQIIELHIKNK